VRAARRSSARSRPRPPRGAGLDPDAARCSAVRLSCTLP
jgi:hypothetical protein